ncbi:META domain-containing protein [Streptomyces finlayi]|uniref:META domain-containing protein n=1 Tax=Streptomyces finlayi TaxID=67296 RepID=A0A7G7BKX9_9ACTN|nr:META domain-containing protein [Streptomyces finlayi]QNE75994.1 META domain-containing protein [Streptomyces finlayi]
MRTQRMAVSVLAVLTLAACGTESGSGAGSGAGTGDGSGTVRTDLPVTGVRWNVQSMTVDGKKSTAPAEAHVTMDSQGKATGNLGCNHYTANVRVEGDTVTLGPGTTTEMACEKDVQDFENALARAFSGTLKAAVVNKTLTLTTGKGDTVTLTSEPARPAAPLTGTTWTVTTLNDGETATSLPAGTRDKAPRIVFGKDGTVEGNLGCNNFRGKATVAGSSITFGPLASTRKMCGDAEMDVERSVLAALSGKTTYEIDGRALSLTAENGKGLGASAPEDGK